MDRRLFEPARKKGTGRLTATAIALTAASLGVLLLIGVTLRSAEPEILPGPAYDGEADELERELWQILRQPRFKTAREREEVVAEVVALGPAAIPLVFAVLSGEFAETFEAEGRARFERASEVAGVDGSLQDQVLFEALGRMPADAVLDHLERVMSGPASLECRLVAARLLPRLPGRRALSVLLELAGGMEPLHLAHIRVQQPIEAALLAILQAEPDATRVLDRDLHRLPDELLPLVARSLPVGRHSEGLKVLFELLDRDPTLDAVVLRRVSELAGTVHDQALDDSLWHIHWLMNNPDWNLRRESAVALGNLQDPTSCPQLIRMLEDADRRVRQGALWALRNMSERLFDEDPRRWREWYREEALWFETTAVTLEEQLLSGDKALVVGAVAGLCQRVLYRHHAAQQLGPLVLHEDPQLVEVACQALAQVGSRRAVPFLVRGLEHPEERVVQAAWKSLKMVTGLSLAPERSAWENELGL